MCTLLVGSCGTGEENVATEVGTNDINIGRENGARRFVRNEFSDQSGQSTVGISCYSPASKHLNVGSGIVLSTTHMITAGHVVFSLQRCLQDPQAQLFLYHNDGIFPPVRLNREDVKTFHHPSYVEKPETINHTVFGEIFDVGIVVAKNLYAPGSAKAKILFPKGSVYGGPREETLVSGTAFPKLLTTFKGQIIGVLSPPSRRTLIMQKPLSAKTQCDVMLAAIQAEKEDQSSYTGEEATSLCATIEKALWILPNDGIANGWRSFFGPDWIRKQPVITGMSGGGLYAFYKGKELSQMETSDLNDSEAQSFIRGLGCNDRDQAIEYVAGVIVLATSPKAVDGPGISVVQRLDAVEPWLRENLPAEYFADAFVDVTTGNPVQ